ncbi:MAG: peptidylprolyl isomerase [Candidatus Krumholzibacteria bacterium]|nr:peptidylprolyl isomerase [Candidatus Krumholzibacteria bacterium]
MIEAGKTVKVHYKGTLDDGSVFDSTQDRDPIEFEMGTGALIPGFEATVAEMEIDETRNVTIPCAEAYGDVNEDMVGEIPRSNLPDDIEPEVGMVLSMHAPDGEMPVRVVAVDEENLTLDANHPLAGQNLTFELTLIEIT